MGIDSLWSSPRRCTWSNETSGDKASVCCSGIKVDLELFLGELEEDQVDFRMTYNVTGWAYAVHQNKASSVRVPVPNVTLFYSTICYEENTDSFPVFNTRVPVGPVFLLGLLALAIVAACASKAVVTLSATSFLMARLSHGRFAYSCCLDDIHSVLVFVDGSLGVFYIRLAGRICMSLIMSPSSVILKRARE
ncbi:hypothetical protein Tco_0644365, partial [Tanacetum coccineum]